MTINKIISKTLLHFKESKELMTPDNFSKRFCEIAKQEKVTVDGCDKIAKYAQRLTPDLQKLMAGYAIKNVDELLYFLTTQLNRLDKHNHKDILAATERLTRILLKILSRLPFDELRRLTSQAVSGDLKMLSHLQLSTDQFKGFHDTYTDTYLKQLETRGEFTISNLPTLVDELMAVLGEKEHLEALDAMVHLLVLALTPSISSNIHENIAKLEAQLKENPELVTAPAVKEELNTCILQRIKDDNDLFNRNIIDANRIIDALLEKIAAMISNSESKSDDIEDIKAQLETIDLNEDPKEVHGRLLTISDKINESIKDFSQSLHSDQDEVRILQERVLELEAELKAAKKEASEDFLTSTLTRRGLSKELETFEKAYQQKGTNYAVVFFDVDHFKKINDTYGHNAGDVILASIGKFLNRHCGETGVVGRYGGEEFILLTAQDDPEALYQSVDALRNKIQNAKFLYQKKPITVTTSAGIALRSGHDSQQATIKKADAHVYEAKNTGRNQVFPKP